MFFRILLGDQNRLLTALLSLARDSRDSQVIAQLGKPTSGWPVVLMYPVAVPPSRPETDETAIPSIPATENDEGQNGAPSLPIPPRPSTPPPAPVAEPESQQRGQPSAVEDEDEDQSGRDEAVLSQSILVGDEEVPMPRAVLARNPSTTSARRDVTPSRTATVYRPGTGPQRAAAPETSAASQILMADTPHVRLVSIVGPYLYES